MSILQLPDVPKTMWKQQSESEFKMYSYKALEAHARLLSDMYEGLPLIQVCPHRYVELGPRK